MSIAVLTTDLKLPIDVLRTMSGGLELSSKPLNIENTVREPCLKSLSRHFAAFPCKSGIQNHHVSVHRYLLTLDGSTPPRKIKPHSCLQSLKVFLDLTPEEKKWSSAYYTSHSKKTINKSSLKNFRVFVCF